MILKERYIILIFTLLGFTSCQGQSNAEKMNDSKTKINPLLCDPETGMCEIPGDQSKNPTKSLTQAGDKKITVVYFTDPICSSCWGIEPQLRKLKLEYKQNINIEYRMGGLLPDWNYNSGGISKPSDVAHHWDEVSIHYDMPIDGDIWLEDPLESSYPPSIAFKAAQLQDPNKAIMFLREIREMVFLKKKNIVKWEQLEIAARKVTLNIEQLKIDFEGKAKTLCEEDLKLAREYEVKGFPTMFFIGGSAIQETVYGSKPYIVYETAILKIHPSIVKSEYNKDWETLFNEYQSFTAREFAELSGTPRNESEKLLNELTGKNKLEKLTTKNGSIWTLK